MQRLFIKIFLWFWVAMALVWSAFLIPTEFSRDDELRERFAALTDQRLIITGRVAVALLTGPGPEAFERFKTELEQQGNAPYPFVFDVSGLEITGREVPAAAQELAVTVLTPNGPERLITREDGVWVGRRFERQGETYGVVQRLPSQLDFPDMPLWPLALRWSLIVLTSGLVCYGLARYLAGPLTTLSAATRDLAQGQLDVRVSQRLGSRHDELGDLGQDFDYMAGRLGDLLRHQRQLLSDISHELRSPLARLSVALGLARQRAGADAEESLDRIERESERLNAMIGELLTLTRLDDPGSLPEPQTVDLAGIVRGVVADGDYEAQARGRGVTLEHCDAAEVRGYPELLRRALENVVRNGIRHTPEGTVVAVAAEVSAETVRVRVVDSGPGVPAEHLGAIFDPFHRVEQARERSSGGIGLGLAISQRAVLAHGGTITAGNRPDGGLEIEITLPLAAALESAPARD